MGGMFTVLKIRDGITSYEDPGWYHHPEGTVASLASADELRRNNIEIPAGQSPPETHHDHRQNQRANHHVWVQTAEFPTVHPFANNPPDQPAARLHDLANPEVRELGKLAHFGDHQFEDAADGSVCKQQPPGFQQAPQQI